MRGERGAMGRSLEVLVVVLLCGASCLSNATSDSIDNIISGQSAKGKFPAFFIFGDSLLDVGNNNYILTIAKANSLPFGIDFPSGPTGRFCNGKLVIDFLAEAIGLPFPPPYLDPDTRGANITKGVNYASAAAGIIRSTGYNFVGRVDFDGQLAWFSNTIQELHAQFGVDATTKLLAKSLYIATFGANDYVNNYFLKVSPTEPLYTPEEYQKLLIAKYTTQLQQLYDLGARNILVTDVGSIGCIPSQLAVKSVNGECVAFENEIAVKFNEELKQLLSKLNTKNQGANYVYVNTFDPVLQYRNNPTKYGFKIGDRACCGGGRFNGRLLCLPVIKPCLNRTAYVFWDAFHPTEATNKLLFALLYKELLRFILRN